MKSSRLFLAFALVVLHASCGEDGQGTDPVEAEKTIDAASSEDLIASIQALEAESFSDESEAREFENKGIVPFWDSLLAAEEGKRLAVLAGADFDTLTLGKAESPVTHDLGIITRLITGGGNKLTREQFQEKATLYQKAGYTLEHSDWHHSAFERNESGQAISEVTFNLQGTRHNRSERLRFKGTLRILWDESGENLRPAHIEVLRAKSAQRRGTPAFVQRAVIEGGNPNPAERDDMGAVSVYDLNGDHLPEIVLGNSNKILWNKGDFQFEPGPIIAQGGRFYDSVIGLTADFNGDAVLDWLSDTASGDLALWLGTPGGGYALNPQKIDLGKFKLRVASFLTAGDIDQDGDLDLYVGQWRSLYEKMPATFWDANDGYGNSLLLNDGEGVFTDATESAGLDQKRFRRSYSGSFLDLDQDQDLDLMVVSDFHGVDVYLNDGTGKFTDKTSSLIDNPHSFGMSHTVADYNNDGRYDFYVLGMGSTTARRLDRMKANPRNREDHNRMRGIMGYGNRMYIAQGDGSFKAPPYYPQVARTGWTWGSASADFDNDGDQDIYAANGHISGKTSRDYCTNFWCRDIYVLKDFERPAIADYLESIPQMEEQSWDGYQVNPLLVNQGGGGFQDFGFLLDVGFNVDSRRVIAADLNLDGRTDLIVGRIESTTGFFYDGKSSVTPPALLILQNSIPQAAERGWIGVTLGRAPGVSPLGATITLRTSGGLQEAVVLSGDSFMCQHPAQKTFGLGDQTSVEELRVRWPNGTLSTLKNPEIGRYHHLSPQSPDQNP